jgi:hypothetical protein
LSSAWSANEKESRNALLADGLIGAWNEAGDRPGDQDAASTTIAHFSTDRLNEIERAGDVGIEKPQNVGEVLIEKAFAETAAGVGQEGGHRPGPDDAQSLSSLRLMSSERHRGGSTTIGFSTKGVRQPKIACNNSLFR